MIFSDATELAGMIRSRQVSPTEVVQAHLERIGAVNPKLNAVVTLLADRALAEAGAAGDALTSGAELGPLHGVPFTVKDSLDTAGVPTQRGSPVFEGRVPDADATSVARLRSAGAILIAKTNLPEFSFAIDTDNPLTGRTNNPWDLRRTPGGSSGGESAAIAAGMSPLGIGSDVAISVRGPAAHTGIIALKATHGRIPATGHWPQAPRRLWHVGPMARSVRDVALAYRLLAGPDGIDGYAIAPAGLDAGVGSRPDAGIRVGWLVEPGFGPVAPEVAATVEAAARALGDLGCVVEHVRLGALEASDGVRLYSTLHVPETKPLFREHAAGRPAGVHGAPAAVLAMADPALADYVAAEQAVERLRDAFAAFFSRYDAFLCPVTPATAPLHGAAELPVGGGAVPARQILRATVPFNLTGLPAVTLRFGTTGGGLPVGVQVVSRWYAESTVLRVASMLEGVGGVRGLRPDL